mgnify:CR=1 FL=1
MAGKGKIVREALKGLSDTAQRWFDSLGKGESEIEELAAWPEFVEKLKNLDKEAPFVFSQYEPEILKIGCKVENIFTLMTQQLKRLIEKYKNMLICMNQDSNLMQFPT